MFSKRSESFLPVLQLTLICIFLLPFAAAQNLQSYVAGINYPAGPPVTPSNTNYWFGGISPFEVHTGDFNGDGKIDVVVAANCALGGNGSSGILDCPASGSAVVVYLSNGDGTFQAPIISGANLPTAIRSIAVGDFNGDGKLDVAVGDDANGSAGDLTILLGNGDGTFTQFSQYTVNGVFLQANTMAVGDFNHDGKLGLAIGLGCYNLPMNGCSVGSVSVYLGNGDGTLATPTTYPTVGNNALFPVVGDFNGDGKVDVIAGSPLAPNDNYHSSLTVLLGHGDGTFSESVTTLPFAGLSALAVSDFNFDGKLDLAITTYPASVQILSGNGDGTFQPPVSYASTLDNVATDTTGIAVTDLNSDGKPDLVISGTGNGGNAVQLFVNNGTGLFSSGPEYDLGGSEFAPIVAQDFNGDGNVDVVLGSDISGNQGGDGSLSVLLGNGNGTMQAATTFSQTLGTVYAAISADVNGDGIPDLVESVYVPSYANQGGILVYLGTGNGQYAAPTLYITGYTTATAVVAGDFNDDGKIDIGVVGGCLDDSCAQGGVSILLGNGDGSFQSPVSYGTGGQYSLSLITGDFNGDGQLDVAVVNQSSSVSILLGNGDGTLQSAVVTSAGSLNFGIAAADFNGDGKTDIALAYYDTGANSGFAQVFLSGANGSLSAAGGPYPSGGNGPVYQVNIRGGALAVADVNRDGKLDIVVANQCQSYDTGCAFGSLAVLLGNGDGTFNSGPIQNALQGDGNYNSLFLADVNGDGILDAIAGDATGVEVLQGNGDGSFAPPTAYAGVVNLGVNTTVALVDLNIIQPGAGTSSTALLVNRAGTYLVSKSSLNPSRAGQTIKLSTVASSSFLKDHTPTGSVTYYEGANELGSASLSAGKVSVKIAGLSEGVHTIVPYYSGDTNFSLHFGTPILQVVSSSNAYSTTTTVASSLNPSSVGQSVTFTATVSSQGSGNPTGIVEFKDGTSDIGSVPLAGNSAALSTSALGVGTHSITAAYSGDLNFKPSTSSRLQQVVDPMLTETSTSLVSPVNPSEEGKPVTFTASVSPQSGSGTPTGKVVFYNGGAVLATVKLVNGACKTTTTKLPAGTDSITAVYTGDSNYSGSTSTPLEQVVVAATTTTLTSTPNPSALGQAVTFTATVTSSAGFPPDGETVAFVKGKTVLGTGSLSSGSATFTTSALKAGDNSIKAEYGGDSSFAASTSKALIQEVN
jgi:hypothetical protein